MFGNDAPGMSTPSSAGIGHNSGDLRAIDPEGLRAELLSSSAAISLRCDDLRNGTLRAPARIADEDEETAKKFGDFIKQIATAIKEVEAERVKQKAPFITAGNTVDGFFRGLSDPLTSAKRTLETTLGDFLRRKEDRQRRAEIERRRQEREEAERKEREIAEAKRQEREKAEAERQKAEDARLEADRIKAEDAKKAAALLRTADKADAAAERIDSKADRLETDLERASARVDSAEIAEATVETQKAGKFARTRGDYGSRATLREFWDFADLERDDLDLEALRQHMPADALAKAVRSFIRAGGRDLRGVRIFKSDRPVIS